MYRIADLRSIAWPVRRLSPDRVRRWRGLGPPRLHPFGQPLFAPRPTQPMIGDGSQVRHRCFSSWGSCGPGVVVDREDRRVDLDSTVRLLHAEAFFRPICDLDSSPRLFFCAVCAARCADGRLPDEERREGLAAFQLRGNHPDGVVLAAFHGRTVRGRELGRLHGRK